MPGMVACCMPDGACVGYLCTVINNQCIEYTTCWQAGGFPYLFNGPDGLSAEYVCEYAESVGIVQGGSCGSLGRCAPTGMPEEECYVSNIGTCCGGHDPGVDPCHWSHAQGCPVPRVYEMLMRPFLSRAFPHDLRFSVDSRGSAPWNTLTPCTAILCDDWTTLQQRCGVEREEIFRRGRACCSPDLKDQVGYLRLAKRRWVCQDPVTHSPLPYQDQATCEGYGGLWRWDGRAYLTPAVPLILNIQDFEDCSKPTKLFLGEGFWRPRLGVVADRCVDPETFAVLSQYLTQQACEEAGKLWRPGTHLRPPRWFGVLRTIGEGIPQLGAPTLKAMHAEMAYNMPGAAEYDWIILLPVEPVEAHGAECCTGAPCVPYCGVENAHLQFPARQTKTREIICHTRDYLSPTLGAQSGAPYLNRSFGEVACGENQPQGISCGVNVPGGITGLVGRSSHVRNALLQNYCVRGGLGCPGDVGCIFNNCQDAFENVVRTYSATSAPLRIEWTDDPQNRGWWIDYVTHLQGWFTQDSFWMAVVAPELPNIPGLGNCYRPQPRWAAWYEGRTIATWPNGAELDSDFVAWVLSQDSGFGLEFSPRYHVCNDALWKYAEQPKALADHPYPPASIQADCDGVPGETPPCLQGGHGVSHWYMAYFGAPMAHQGLYHQTQRQRFTNAQKTSYQTEFGWAKLAFSTGPPIITRVE